MKKGFTLIELIAVIVILGIIALIATVSVMKIFQKNTESLYTTQVEIIESAADKWVIANSGVLPVDGSTYNLELSKLVSDGYLDDGDILDPRTRRNIEGYIEISFDSSVNQYKAKLINENNSSAGKEAILAAINPVTSGEGLYSDEFTSGRYYFKGTNPNNYIRFNNETWRIISIESDGKIKIIKQTGFTHTFDNTGDRTSANGNPACTQTTGCPIWAKNNSTVVKDSNLMTYLNEDYYTKLSKKAKNSIISSKWCYKYLNTPTDNSASDFIEDQLFNFCETESVSDKIGLINVKEVIESSNGSCGYLKECQNTYLNNGTDFWILNYSNNNLIMNSIGQVASSNANASSINVRPVVYLDSSTELNGKGISSNPFTIK